MVILEMLLKIYQAIIMIGHFTWFFAAVCLCAEIYKHMKDWPKYITYPIIAICFMSIAFPAAEGFAQYFPSEEAVREQEEESESIEESINAAIESAYDQGYEDALEDQ